MSKYPSWWDSTITIYNKFTDNTTRVTRWYRHIIEKQCFWKNVGSKVNIGDIVLDTESITCRIPEQADFLQAYDWVNLPNDQKSLYFTLQPEDIVIHGEALDDIDEYTAGSRATDIINKYRLRGCIVIREVSVDTMTGMITPHYHIRGL